MALDLAALAAVIVPVAVTVPAVVIDRAAVEIGPAEAAEVARQVVAVIAPAVGEGDARPAAAVIAQAAAAIVPAVPETTTIG
jgi:hypothetical protein